jgi:hypothetical protein
VTDAPPPQFPSDDDVAAARDTVERLLAGSGVDLSDPSLWEPAADLEAEVMASALAKNDMAAARTRGRWLLAAAAAVVAVVAIGAIVYGAIRSTPDWSVTLAATDLAPDATASIEGWNETSGTRVRLDIDGLPPAPDGFFYELWFSEGPRHISAGTFRAADGVEMWTAVRRSDFPRLWITLEPIDDDESPSPNTVLDTG